MTTCTCWVDYPNKAHKKANGKWKCVDCYINIRKNDGYRRKTKCIRKEQDD